MVPVSVGNFISGWDCFSLLFRYYFASSLFFLIVLSWSVLIPQRATSSGKSLHNSLSFSYNLSSWLTLFLIKILCTVALELFAEWVSLTKVSIYLSFIARKSPKDSTKFVITSIVCWEITSKVFLTKLENTVWSSIVTVDKTRCKLMVRLLLLFSYFKYIHVSYFHHTCDCVKYTSLDVPTHWIWSVPVAEVMASGTTLLTTGVLLTTRQADLMPYYIFQRSDFPNFLIPYKKYNPVGYLDYLYYLRCMQ